MQEGDKFIAQLWCREVGGYVPNAWEGGEGVKEGVEGIHIFERDQGRGGGNKRVTLYL